MKKIKEILIFCILVIVIGIAMATVVIKIEQKSNEDNADKENINSESTSNITPTEDALRFKKEYEDVNGTIREKDGMLFNNVDIPEQNPIQYINIDEFVDILNNKSGIVFLSSPTCPYCRASISSLLKAAKELKKACVLLTCVLQCAWFVPQVRRNLCLVNRLARMSMVQKPE